MFVYVYFPHHLELEPFSHQVVIVTTLARDTQEHIKNSCKTSLVLHYSRTVGGLDTRDTRELALSRICVLFWIPQKSLLKSSFPKKVLAKIFVPEIQNFNSKKILPESIPVTSNPEYPPPPPHPGLPDSIELLHSTFSCSSVTSSLTWLTIQGAPPCSQYATEQCLLSSPWQFHRNRSIPAPGFLPP